LGGSREWGGHCSWLRLPQITPSGAGGGFFSDDHSRHAISGLLPGGVEWLEESEDFQLVLSQETREGVVRVAEDIVHEIVDFRCSRGSRGGGRGGRGVGGVTGRRRV
jgi:hypothetical protein